MIEEPPIGLTVRAAATASEIAVSVGTVDEIKIDRVEDKAEHHELLMDHLDHGSDGLTLADRDDLTGAM